MDMRLINIYCDPKKCLSFRGFDEHYKFEFFSDENNFTIPAVRSPALAYLYDSYSFGTVENHLVSLFPRVLGIISIEFE